MSDVRAGKTWRTALWCALPIVTLVVVLDYYWFAVADRYIVFLYHHDMGALVPDTTPFSVVTRSRYWMTGLVAGGMVAVLYLAANWLGGRLWRGYRPPTWQRVWVLCAAGLAVAIPAITMTANAPTLPLVHALQVLAATCAGLALALMPGRLAAEAPRDLLWLGADGFGLMLLALNLIHLEKLSRWLAGGGERWVWIMAGSLAAGVGWLLLVTAASYWRRRPGPGVARMVLAMLFMSYLMMPLVHHVLGTDGYFYISDSDNFFARSAWVQIAVWLAAAGVAWGLQWMRGRLWCRRESLLKQKGG